MVELFVMEYLTVLYMIMAYLFMDSRYSRRRTVFIVSSVTILLMAAVVALYRAVDMDTAFWTYAISIHIPLILLLFTLSRFRGWRLIFQQLSIVLFCTLIHHISGLFYYLSGNRFWVMVLSCTLLSTGVIWFLVRFLRPLFFQILLELHRGWWLICLVMATYYIIAVFLIPGYAGFERSSSIIKPVIALLMMGFYSILMFLFFSIRKEAETRHSAQISALQLSALQSRMEAVRVAEDVIRTERHDLRHRLQAVAELVARGDTATALDFLDAAQKRLDEQKAVRWCRPPVLDAVFSSYFDQAENEEISVDATVALPDELPVNEGELAVVLANALENAIHANLKLPPKQRKIFCRMVASPSLMLELSNPCDGKAAFDDQGLLVAQREGHGIGTQSIVSFCKKYGAVCHYDLTDGIFCLRLVL